MRKLIFLSFLFCSTILSAQNLADYEEVVYLKNGSIIRGVIIEQVPGKSIKIQTKDRNVFVYQMEEVDKIAKELMPESASGSHTDTRKAKGFEMYIDNGLALWITDDPYPMNILTLTPGYKFNRHVFLGFSTGVIARKGFISVPAFFDLRFTLTKTKVAPLIQLNFGYMSRNLVSSDDNYYYADVSNYGGFIFGFKPGLGINLKKNIDLNFYTGYQLGSQVVNVSGYGMDDTDFGLMHFYTLTAGVKF